MSGDAFLEASLGMFTKNRLKPPEGGEKRKSVDWNWFN